ncbi:hypothetical protein AW736_17245 [Termitidicoccus mucosus]|uniref:TonB-dependent receptor plug domain-containing protein n=1 Tax=Termitidicoccus mucosus TaxID=1184151 RepID=A0A178IEJ5_9BACT|nr:hypothetical protein AW736_17245 [Opitutaceae bacterium TSB47]
MFRALCAFASAGLIVSAQQEPAAAGRDEVVNLPTFTITEKPVSEYQSHQALSTTRVAMSLQDVPQTISVVTSQLFTDTQAPRMLDVAKYVTPVVESTLPYGGDRYQIRGFQVSQEFIDGTVISGADGYSMSLAPYNIERIEIIKGPNAILVPGGSPGGVMNPITKSPLDYNQITVTGGLAQYMGNGADIDINRVLDPAGSMAARLVAAWWYDDLYAKNQYRHGWLVAPSFSLRLSPQHKLILKAEFLDNRETNLSGLPLDPHVGTRDSARRAAGLPRDWSFGDDSDSRHRSTERVSAELLSTLGSRVTMRLYVMGDHVRRKDAGGTGAAIKYLDSLGNTVTETGSRNPFTGLYEPGVIWNTAAYNADTTGTVTLAGTPLALPDASEYIYSRSATSVDLEYTEGHIKNEYAIRFQPSWGTSTTLLGLAANTSVVRFIATPPGARPDVHADNLGAITYPPRVYPAPTDTNRTDKKAKQNDLQLFIFETLGLFGDRILLSGGVSRFFGELTRTDSGPTDRDPTLGHTTPSYNLSDTALSGGVVVKPLKELSFFYGYNESGGTMPGSLSAGKNAPSLKVAAGNQNEFGVKTALLNNTLTASFAYFIIEQENYPVPNSEFYTLVSQGITPPPDFPNPLYLNLKSKGWEFEARYSYNRNLTVFFNYSDYEIRQPVTDVRVRGVPDRSLGAYVDYRFTNGLLAGFGVNVGVDYKGDVAGDTATGYTTTRPLPDGSFAASQPTFTVGSRTVVNLGLSYRRADWIARLSVANLFDEDYVLAAGSRTSVIEGDPRSVRFTVSYTFK